MSRVITAAALLLALAACGQTAPPPAAVPAPIAREAPSGSSTDRPSSPDAPPAEDDGRDPGPLPQTLALDFAGIGGQPGGPNGASEDGHAMLATADGGLLAGAAGILRRDPAGRWTALGAGLDGNVRSLAVAPDGAVLAGLRGGAAGGVARLASGETNWELLGHAFPDTSVGAVAAASGAYFAATGDHDVFRWDAAARDWTPVGPRRRDTLIGVLAGAPDGSLLAAGTAGTYLPSIFRLRDGNWSEVPGSAALPGDVTGLAAAADGTVFASVATPSGGDVLRLPPSGARFARAGNGLPAGTNFEIGLSAEGVLVAGASSVTGGVYRLAGSTWVAMGTGLPPGPVEAVAAGAGGVFARVGGTVFALRGGAWQALHHGLATAGANAIIRTAERGIVAGTREGLAGLSESGRWVAEAAGASGTELLALAEGPDGIVLGGTAESGVVRRGRDGAWETLAGGLPAASTVRSLAVDPAGTGWAAVELTSDRAGGVFRLPAGSKTWQPAGAGLPADGGVTSLVLDPDGSAWAGVNGGTRPGVFRLARDADAWTRAAPAPEGVSRVALARDGSIVFGTYGAGVRRLDRLAGAPTEVGHSLPGGLDGWILDLEDDPRLGLLAGTNAGLFRLAGGVWEAVDAGLPRAAVTDILRDGDRLVVATRSSGAFAAVSAR